MDRRNLSFDLKAELEAEMDRNKKRNDLGSRGRFVSNGFLVELLTEKRLNAHLKEVHVIHDWFRSFPGVPSLPREFRKLSSTIRSDAPILYCILILVDRPKAIQNFLRSQPAINDRTLFGRDHTGHRTYCSRDELKAIPLFEGFAEDFYQKQWHFPPMLYTSEGTPKFDLIHFQFPFADDQQPIGRGGYASVYKTRIGKEYVQSTGDDEAELSIAYKKMDLSNDGKKRNQSYNEVRVVRARRHPNVTELIGSFVTGLEISGLPDDHPEGYHAQILYMLYPLAEMDMKRWLETRYPKLFPNDKGLERHIYSDAMLGLMSGVSWLHKEIDYEVAFHRDLKPENVLLFKSKTLVWKIADFGCANLKSLKDTTTKDWRGSPYWAPPEFMVDKGKEKSGRSHDIYSLGCMFIMLVTIIVHGWTDGGLPEFERRRVQHCEQNASQTISNEVGAFHNSEAVVLDWVEELKREAECDEKLEAVIRVIKEMLLSSEERISAWESVVYLYEATGEWESDVTDQTLKGLKAEKHDKVLEKLKSTIQDSRGVVDANKPRGPVKRAKEWKRSDGFLAILRDKEWFESIPKTTEELKERQSVTESPISTLPEDLSNKEPIFGYQKTFEDMTEAFSSCNIVVLCGLGGIGKTRMALSYVCQFTNATSKPDDRTDTVDKRHILWVSMEDQQTILQGYREIANKTGAGHGVIHDAAADLVSHIERWLQNPDNGQWILVLDNLCDDSLTFPDHAHRMDRINLEKIQHHGQILITTRRRDFNIKLLNELRPEVIPLSPPSLGIRLRIYKHFIDTSLFSLTEPGNEGRLLGYLTFPKLIIDAVQHMNTKNISPKTLLQGMQTEGFRKVQDFSGDMMWYLLKHLLSQPLRPEEEDWPYEIEILFMLAMFGREGASLDFLRNGIDEESAKVLDQALGTLQNSFLVERRDDTSEMYCVNQTVQATLLAWTEEPEWRAIMFRRLDLMLSTIYENYNLKVSEDMSIIFTLRKDLFSQLERLLTFMKPDARESSASYDGAIELTPRAVQGIIEFSRLLCDQDRYEEATDVLDFAREHYPVDELSRDGPVDDDSLPKLDIWYNLDQQRMWSYLLRPAPWEDELGSWTDRNWTEAEYIVRAQIEKVDSWENPQNEFWILNRRWELSLDLVRVCCYLKQWGRVEEALKSTDRVNIAIRPNDRKDMPTFTDMEGVRRIIDEAGNRGMKRPKEREGLRREDALRKLAAKRKLEQGLFYRERGLHEEACGNKSEAVSSWRSAREALRIAEVALREWSPKDERYEEVLVYIAEANTRLGARGDFKEAYNTFERALRRTEKNYGSHCKHAWDMECRMNAVKLRTGQDLKTAVSSLTSLFAKYKDRFGEKAAATVRCFYQLEEAYIKSGQWDEASALSMQMGIKPRLQERYNTYWTVSGAVIILCGVCSLWMVRCPGNVLHLWLRNGAGSTP